MRIGVTGAAGFVGSHLVRHLAGRMDLEILALARTMRGPKPTAPNVTWIQGDLASSADCARFASGLDAVVHLAHVNVPLTSNRDLPADVAANLGPTLTLLQALRKERRRVHVVYASSGGALYRATSNSVPLTEKSPLEPLTSYGIVKTTTEAYLRMAATEEWVTATSLRIGNAYGSVLPRERLQGFIGVAVHEIAAGRPVRLFGNPDNVRDYVHLSDVARAFELAITPRDRWSVYNIGSGVGTSVRQLVDLLRSIVTVEVTVQEDIGEQAEAARLPSWAVLDCTRAQAELGWSPEIDLAAGIRELWERVVR
jgi:UDP-glucose 4-epimerase